MNLNHLQTSEFKPHLRARTCPICECPATLPRRRYNTQGNAIAGCVHPCHDAYLPADELIGVRVSRLSIRAHILDASQVSRPLGTG